MITEERTCNYCRRDKACWACLPQTSYLEIAREEIAKRAASDTHMARLTA